METVYNFLVGLMQLALFIIIIIGVLAFHGYNTLRGLSEAIREAWSNIGVVGRKQASLVNQLIDVVKGYQESEKFVMLKVSEDMSNAANELPSIFRLPKSGFHATCFSRCCCLNQVSRN